MANDHFISRFLTRRWEVLPGRMLHFFDFGTSSFGAEPSATLFADDGLHATETGKRLNELVEQPVAQHLRVLETNPRADLTDPGSWRIFRALASLWWLQAQRITDAKTPGALAMTLDQLLVQGEAVIDAIGRLARENFELFVVKTRANERLFFTEAASFPIPLAGAVLLALPLSPHHFMTLVRRDVHEPEAALQGVLNTESLLPALSIGVGSQVHRVVLPPGIAPANGEDQARLREGLSILRTSARGLVELFGEASAVAGLPSWKVT